MGFRLGVDLGTTFTAAAVDDGTGARMLGLGNRALQVPSTLFLNADGTFLFGEAAERRAAQDPARSVREFKRRLGDTVPILLAGQPFSPQALTAHLLAWVISVATEREGSPPDEVVVTYPANWGGYKRELMHQVLTLADVPDALTCTEPEAAATRYASRARLSPHDKVAVYDLGGGTFDICVLEKQESGFSIVGSPDGVEHLGGIDFDEAVFRHVLNVLSEAGTVLDEADDGLTAALARLRRDCVDAKEALSSDIDTDIRVELPGISTTVRLTRAELEGMIAAPLQETLAATRRALRSAQLTSSDLAAVVLVGGSSRIPQVSHLLQSELGVTTAMDTHPKHDIALGAAQYQQHEEQRSAPNALSPIAWPTRGTAETASTLSPEVVTTVAAEPSVVDTRVTSDHVGGPVSTATEGGTDEPTARWRPWGARAATGDPRSRRRNAAMIAAAALIPILIAAGGVGVVALVGGDDSPSSGGASTGTSGSSPSTQDPGPEPQLLSRGSVVVPVDVGEEYGLDLLVVHDKGGRKPLVHERGDQLLVSISPDREVLQVVSQDDDENRTLSVMHKDGVLLPMFTPQPPTDKECGGRLAWSPTTSGSVAILCDVDTVDAPPPAPTQTPTQAPTGAPNTPPPSSAPPTTSAPPTSEPPTTSAPPTAGPPSFTPAARIGWVPADPTILRAVFIAQLNDRDQVVTATMRRVDGIRDGTFSNVGFTSTGGLVLTDEGDSSPGIYYQADAGGELRRLTSGEDLDSAGSPVDDRVAFQRDGSLYMVAAGDGALGCSTDTERDATTGRLLCRLTFGGPGGVAKDEDPAWSWDGRWIAFRRTVADVTTLMKIDLAHPQKAATVYAENLPPAAGPPAWSRR